MQGWGRGTRYRGGIHTMSTCDKERGSDAKVKPLVLREEKRGGEEMREKKTEWKGSRKHERLAVESAGEIKHRQRTPVASFLESPSFLLSSSSERGDGRGGNNAGIYSEKRIRRLLVRRSRKRRKTSNADSRGKNSKLWRGCVYRAQLREGAEERGLSNLLRGLLPITMSDDSSGEDEERRKGRSGGSARVTKGNSAGTRSSVSPLLFPRFRKRTRTYLRGTINVIDAHWFNGPPSRSALIAL